MTLSVRLNEEDEKLINAYADLNNITMSDLIRNVVQSCLFTEISVLRFLVTIII